MRRQNSGPGAAAPPKGRDFYAILGVTKEATDDDLKKAFRKCAMQYHPDRNRGNEEEATNKFKECKEAHDVLSDPKKRRVYDKYGEEGLKEGGPGGPGGRGDIFSQFFGGHSHGEDEADSGRGEDLRLKMGVELKDLYNGLTKRVPMQKQFVCSGCKGSGSSKPGAGKTCASCQGQGVRMEMRQMGPFMTQQPVECRRCNGEGVMINPGDECKTCNGKRIYQKVHYLEIPIERGLANGDKVVLKGESNQVPNEEPGDVVVFIVEQTPDDYPFKRKGDDLLYKHRITLAESLIGFKFTITHMDERTLVVASQSGDVIRPGSKKVVIGEGMPIKGMPSERGRLIIEFEVDFPGPEFFTDSVRTQLEKLLPPIPEFSLPKDAEKNFVEHTAVDYVEKEDYSKAQAYDNSDDEGDQRGGMGGGQPQCQTQ